MLAHSTLLNQTKEQLIKLRTQPDTVQRHLYWIEQFLTFHTPVITPQLNQHHLLGFLNFLSARPYISVTTQLQAFDALLFLFRTQLKQSIQGLQFQCSASKSWQQPKLQAAC